MKLGAAVAGALLALLSLELGERALRESAARESGPPGGIERLVAPERAAAWTVAAITVELPGRGELVYARRRGTWRCASAFGAPARADRIEELFAALVESRGVARHGLAPAAAGLSSEARALVRLHGPRMADAADRDQLAAFELGAGFSVAGRGRAFARRPGEERVLEIDHDPRALLEWSTDEALPPLLDERLCAGAFDAGFVEPRRIVVRLARGGGLDLESYELAPAAAGRAWLAVDGLDRRQVLPFRIAGYLTFLARAPYIGLAHPELAPRLGLEPPAARVELHPAAGEPLVVEIGAATQGRVFVRSGAAMALMEADPEHAALLAPDGDMLCDERRANPWEAWLTR